jgi:CHAD domain-containing protein
METAQVGSVSNLHDLRVQMKRMKAIFAFLQSVYGKGSLGKLPENSFNKQENGEKCS